MAVTTARRPQRCRGDRASAMVELALVLPLLALLAFGMAEAGAAWVVNTRVEGAAAQAARVGSASGARAEADRDILVSLRASLPPGELARLDRVIIFKPATASGGMPAGCIKATGDTSEVGTASCNSYSGDTVRSVSTSSMAGFGGGATAKDRYWSPVNRNDALIDPPDYLGVWVRTTHQSVTGVAFHGITVTEQSVFRIQPDLAG